MTFNNRPDLWKSILVFNGDRNEKLKQEYEFVFVLKYQRPNEYSDQTELTCLDRITHRVSKTASLDVDETSASPSFAFAFGSLPPTTDLWSSFIWLEELAAKFVFDWAKLTWSCCPESLPHIKNDQWTMLATSSSSADDVRCFPPAKNSSGCASAIRARTV